jgi:hypothetical protein
VRYQHAQLRMPPTGKLPAAEIAALEEWVRRGLPFPGSDTTSKTRPAIDLVQGRKFWSFQQPRSISPPTVRDNSWPRKRIDAFLLATMEKRGLVPSAQADRRVLIRRVTFDLIGLPPTPEEMEVALRDPAEEWYERLVERLLASPRYGERWGRVWLDLARYCDVPEQWAELKAEAWPYRDWVVGAFNKDVPYDRFVQLQLAADFLPDATPADHAALGFLGLSPVYWKELQLEPGIIKVVVAEEWEERIGAVTTTFLGLTAACARCHDHKFDPITTQDYYALAGVLASTRQVPRFLLPDTQAIAVQQAHLRVQSLQAQLDKLKKMQRPDAETTKQIEACQGEIETLRRTPHFESVPVAGVEDASLQVLPDGPSRTKLDYKPGVGQDVAVQTRGNPMKPGLVVPRRFLAVLSAGEPRPFTQGSGRLELARAIVTEGAPLASRVIVNRIWKQHFGAGLVETPSDFGAQGERPSHPELLDDLAASFMANGWSLKWLHREIVLSAAYRQASDSDKRRQAVDPDNRLLWRMNRRRLEIESWRDAMLQVTSTLSQERGGPSLGLGDPKNSRRTLYGTVTRRELHDLLRLHDFPDPTASSAGRTPTTTPLQQLFVLNSPFIQQQAAALSRRLKADAPAGIEARIQRAYQLLYGRSATERQVRLAVAFLTPESDALWQQYCQVLLGSNEFLVVD